MADQVTVTITTAVTSAGDFDVVELGGNNVTNNLATNVSLATLQSGQTYTIASDTWGIRLHNQGDYGCAAADVDKNFSQVTMQNSDFASLVSVVADYGGSNINMPIMPGATPAVVTVHLPTALEGSTIGFSIYTTAAQGRSWRLHVVEINGTDHTYDLSRPSASPSQFQTTTGAIFPIGVVAGSPPKYAVVIYITDL